MPSLFCFNLWYYCSCARLISHQLSFFTFVHTILTTCPEMPSLFLFQSVVLLRMRQAHFSPVVFVHFYAYYLQMPWNASLFCFILWSYCACARFISRQSSLFIFARICKCPEKPFFFVSICGLTAQAPGSFLASRLCSFFALICNSFFSFCGLTAHAPGSFREFPWRRRSTASHIMLRTRLFILPRRLRSVKHCACAKIVKKLFIRSNDVTFSIIKIFPPTTS